MYLYIYMYISIWHMGISMPFVIKPLFFSWVFQSFQLVNHAQDFKRRYSGEPVWDKWNTIQLQKLGKPPCQQNLSPDFLFTMSWSSPTRRIFSVASKASGSDDRMEWQAPDASNALVTGRSFTSALWGKIGRKHRTKAADNNMKI